MTDQQIRVEVMVDSLCKKCGLNKDLLLGDYRFKPYPDYRRAIANVLFKSHKLRVTEIMHVVNKNHSTVSVYINKQPPRFDDYWEIYKSVQKQYDSFIATDPTVLLVKLKRALSRYEESVKDLDIIYSQIQNINYNSEEVGYIRKLLDIFNTKPLKLPWENLEKS